MAYTSNKRSRIEIVAPTLGLAIALLAMPACGGDDEPGCADAECPGSSSAASTGNDDSSSSAPASESSSGAAESSSTAPAESSSESGTAGDGRCSPSNAAFGTTPPALPQASISFDFDAQTCSVMGLMSVAPQIVIDVQDSGLLDATLYGLEIVDASAGLKFNESPQGDSQVIDFDPGIIVTFEATTIPGDVPVTIEFFVDTAGPALRDVSAIFG